MAPGRPTPDGDTPVERVAVSGAALAALLQAVNSSSGDCDGVLFGHVERNTTSTMVDEDVGPQTSHDISAVVTGHFCSGGVTSFYDATGNIDVVKFAQMIGEREARGGDPPIGWFVGRRGSSMRPSMREFTVTANLRSTQFRVPAEDAAAVSSEDLRDHGKVKPDSRPLSSSSDAAVLGEGNGLSSKHGGAVSKLIGIPASSPFIFFLFTESTDANSIHTHEYRAYQYRTKLSGAGCFESRSVRIVNIGPALVNRGLYDSFAPAAPFPWFLKPSGSLDDREGSDHEGLRRLSLVPHNSNADHVQMEVGLQEADQALLDMYSQDFSVDRLHSLTRTEGEGGSVRELETLYRTMLRKLDVLAKQVCEGNEVIYEQVQKS